ncbi:MAG TPA: 4-hydroxy-tetrahydrodipicolinate reductase [Actinomycetota bacterium]|nr:4-hydroxy-tetrahydrodipicolinate reductase [Actinomycetota bacterium]
MGVKVGVLGAAGRMGATVCDAVDSDNELELVARVDLDDSLDQLVESHAEVVVDFTTPDAVKDNIKFCLENGIHAVVGTTGISEGDLKDVAGWAAAGDANAFIAPNFAIGAVLMMRFASEAAPYFDNAEIIERHHENKLDAPSGTALRTASLMNESRGKSWSQLAKGSESLAGSRGGESDGVRIHSVRVPGSVAHQEVIFGTLGETLTIRHDSLDRSSFMPGVVLAVKKVGSLDGLVVGLENLLDL